MMTKIPTSPYIQEKQTDLAGKQEKNKEPITNLSVPFVNIFVNIANLLYIYL